MIKFGTKVKALSADVIDHACQSCGAAHLTHSFIRKIYYALYLPVYAKVYPLIFCQNCEAIADIDSNVNEKPKAPLWGFLGIPVILAAVIAGLCIYQGEQNDIHNFYASPKIGGMAIVNAESLQPELHNYPYVAIRIKNIGTDSVTLEMSSISSNKASGIRKQLRKHKLKDKDFVDVGDLALSEFKKLEDKTVSLEQAL